MRKKFNSDEERKAARTIQNREAQKRSRAKAKVKPESTTKVTTGFVISPNNYNQSYFNYCSGYPYSHLITFTNKDLVTLNMHDKAVKNVIDWLLNKGYITNYLKTNEYNGGNYHAHVLVQYNRWGVKTTLRELLKNKWGNGFYRVDDIKNETHRLNAIQYCLKQIDVTSNSDRRQSIADTMSIVLTQTFEGLKQHESNRLRAFKVENGLQTYWKHILVKNGGTK
jgi:hypothetical protein